MGVNDQIADKEYSLGTGILEGLALIPWSAQIVANATGWRDGEKRFDDSRQFLHSLAEKLRSKRKSSDSIDDLLELAPGIATGIGASASCARSVLKLLPHLISPRNASIVGGFLGEGIISGLQSADATYNSVLKKNRDQQCAYNSAKNVFEDVAPISGLIGIGVKGGKNINNVQKILKEIGEEMTQNRTEEHYQNQEVRNF